MYGGCSDRSSDAAEYTDVICGEHDATYDDDSDDDISTQ